MIHLQLERMDVDSSNIDALNVLLPHGLILTEEFDFPVCTEQLDILLYMTLRERIPLTSCITPGFDVPTETVYIEGIDYLTRSLTLSMAGSAVLSEHHYVYMEGQPSSDENLVRSRRFDVETYTTP